MSFIALLNRQAFCSQRIMNALLLGGTGVEVPSGFALAATKSGTSFVTHFSPFHSTSTLSGFHGLPFMSHEARLYRMRRLAGQLKPNFGNR